ncbi:MAG: hypothetical protein RBJ76_13745 [Stenomitos frigidus ULC029]
MPSATVISAGLRILVGRLPMNAQGFTTVRTPTQYTITNTAAVSLNATSMLLTAAGFVAPATSVLLQAGTILTFGAVQVTVLADVTLNGTAVSVPIAAATATIAMSVTATTYALLSILGGDSADLNVTDKEVSTRGFDSGIFDDARKVMIGAEIPWSNVYRLGDPGIDQVIEPAALSALATQEVFVTIVYPDGKYRSAACFIKGYKEGNKLDDIRRLSWTFRIVGGIVSGNTYTG